MQQITNQKYDSLREQLTQSINMFQSYRPHNQLYQSSILEDSVPEQSDHEQNTLHSSIRRKKQQARVMQSQYMQDAKFQQATQILINKIVMIQKNYRQYHFIKTFKKRLRQMRNRKCVVSEFHKIEKNYNEDLNIIVNILIKEIKQQQLLNQDEMIQLFLNVEQISQLNKKFYNTIELMLKNYHHFTLISQQFKIYVPFFKIYYDYCSRFQLDEVSKLRKQSPQFNEYIENVENRGVLKGLTFESFLIKPVQQLPRYVLLLENLVKFTESTHPDYSDLKSLQEHFYKINQQINKMIDTTQSNLKLLAQFGTLDQQEIEMIQKKQQEEEQFLKKLQQLLSIQVLAHLKQKDGFNTYIIYIIQIQISNYRTCIYHRYSDLCSIPCSLQINNFEPLQNGCIIFTSEEEIIEQRKEIIVQFLTSIIINPKLKTYQDDLIQLLDLPENIFQIEQNDLALRGSYTTMRNTLLIEEELEVLVNLADGKSLTLQITKNCRSLDLIDTVSRSIFLDKNLDFKLMIVQNDESRFLDDNEVIFKVIQKYNHKHKTFFSKLFSSISTPIFYLRKYLYLGFQIESQLYNSNKSRCQLLFYQELNDLKNTNLTQQEYVNLCAFICCILYEVDSLKKPEDLHTQLFQEYIPKQIFYLISKKEWKRQIYNTIRQILVSVDNFLKVNKTSNRIKILEQEFLNSLYRNQQHGMKVFKVMLLRTELFKKMEIPQNVFLGIKHNELQIFEDYNKNIIQMPMLQLQAIKIKNNILELTFLDGCIKLKQKQIFEVYRLLEEYQQINLIKSGRSADMVDTNDVSQIK